MTHAHQVSAELAVLMQALLPDLTALMQQQQGGQAQQQPPAKGKASSLAAGEAGAEGGQAGGEQGAGGNPSPWQGWDSLTVANLAKALAYSGYTGPGCDAFWQAVTAQGCACMEGATSQTWCNMLWAGARCRMAPHVQGLLFRHGMQCMGRMLARATEQDVAMALHSCAAVGYAGPPLLDFVQQLCSDPQQHLRGRPSSQGIGNTLWACAKLVPPETYPSMTPLFDHLVPAFGRILRNAKPQEISNVAWACATVGYGAQAQEGLQSGASQQQGRGQQGKGWQGRQGQGRNSLQRHSPSVQLLAAVAAEPSCMDRATTQGWGNLMWSCAKLVAPSDAPMLAPLFAKGLACVEREVWHRGVMPQEVSNCLWASATLGLHAQGVAKLGRAVEAALPQGLMDAAAGQAWSNTLWALATSRVYNAALFAQGVLAVARMAEGMGTGRQGAAGAAAAAVAARVGKHQAGHRTRTPRPPQGTPSAAEAMQAQAQAAAQAPALEPQVFSNSLWACAQSAHWDAGVGRLVRALVTSRGGAHGGGWAAWKPQELANGLFAWAVLSEVVTASTATAATAGTTAATATATTAGGYEAAEDLAALDALAEQLFAEASAREPEGFAQAGLLQLAQAHVRAARVRHERGPGFPWVAALGGPDVADLAPSTAAGAPSPAFNLKKCKARAGGTSGGNPPVVTPPHALGLAPGCPALLELQQRPTGWRLEDPAVAIKTSEWQREVARVAEAVTGAPAALELDSPDGLMTVDVVVEVGPGLVAAASGSAAAAHTSLSERHHQGVSTSGSGPAPPTAVAIECDGPFHYFTDPPDRLDGPTLLRHSHLRAAYGGAFVALPYQEWDDRRQPGVNEGYLKQRLVQVRARVRLCRECGCG